MPTRVIFTALLITATLAVPALAEEGSRRHDDSWRSRQAVRLDRLGDRIDARLDRQADRIERHFDRRAERAATVGNDRLAGHLRARGERIARHYDRKGDRIDARLDRRADRIERHFEHRPAHPAAGRPAHDHRPHPWSGDHLALRLGDLGVFWNSCR